MLKVVGWIVVGLLALCLLAALGVATLPGPFMAGHFAGEWLRDGFIPGPVGVLGGLVGGAIGLLAGLFGLFVGLAVLLLVVPAVLGTVGLVLLAVMAVVAGLALLFAAPVLLPLLLVVGLVWLVVRAGRQAPPAVPRS